MCHCYFIIIINRQQRSHRIYCKLSFSIIVNEMILKVIFQQYCAPWSLIYSGADRQSHLVTCTPVFSDGRSSKTICKIKQSSKSKIINSLFRKTLLQEVQYPKCTWVKVQMYWHQNVLRKTKTSYHYAEGAVSKSFEMAKMYTVGLKRLMYVIYIIIIIKIYT